MCLFFLRLNTLGPLVRSTACPMAFSLSFSPCFFLTASDHRKYTICWAFYCVCPRHVLSTGSAIILGSSTTIIPILKMRKMGLEVKPPACGPFELEQFHANILVSNHSLPLFYSFSFLSFFHISKIIDINQSGTWMNSVVITQDFSPSAWLTLWTR